MKFIRHRVLTDLDKSSNVRLMMSTEQPNWERVLPLAESLGVPFWTRTKWKQRGVVPARWHLKLIEASNGGLTAADLAPPHMLTINAFPAPQNGGGK